MNLAGRLSGIQRLKSWELLDMMYTPSELALEIGITTRQIYRVYIPLGVPAVKVRGRLFINGEVFSKWYEAVYQKESLRQNQAFCLTCKKAVIMQNVEEHKKGRLSYWLCDCSECGRRLARIITRDRLV